MKYFFFLSFLFFSFTATAQQHHNGNMYLYYNTPNNSNYNIDQEITPLQLANGTFWALTFRFNELSDGGYIGIQTGYSDTKTGLLIFSIWNAVDAQRGDNISYVVNFDGEGSGKSCRISIPLVPTHTYRLRIWQLESSISGTYWGAWILDKNLGKEYYLGKIKTNAKSTLSGTVSNFVEYFGDSKPCNNVPYSQARFYPIKFNCNDEKMLCQDEFIPVNYHYADCVYGSCQIKNNYSTVSFGGSDNNIK